MKKLILITAAVLSISACATGYDDPRDGRVWVDRHTTKECEGTTLVYNIGHNDTIVRVDNSSECVSRNLPKNW